MKTIQLSKGYVAIVDDEDFDRLSRFKWQVLPNQSGKLYAGRGVRLPDGRQSRRRLHHEVLNVPAGTETDHINGDGLDNRKSNLRVCTTQENLRSRKAWGRSGFKGVNRRKDRWRAHIFVNRKCISLGTFSSPEEAARAYDGAAKRLFGEFARLNFPEAQNIVAV